MRRHTASARSKIVGWMLLLVGAALALPTIGITVVWQTQLDDQIDAQLLREGEKLRQFAASSEQPGTGPRYPDGASLLTAFMTINLPNREETFFSIVDGQADRRSSASAPARLDRDPEVVALLSALPADRARVGWLTDASVGRVRYGVIPVRVAGDPHDVRLVILEFRDRQLSEERRVAKMLLGTGFGALVLAGGASWLVAGRILAPVRLVRHTAARISESDLTQRLDVRGDDDVAALAHTFNRMLDRLEHAFTAQRRFLDEVGHELRTPITVVRGHLELLDPGGPPRVGWDVAVAERAATRALVLDELDRMSRIVDDLLLLAKAERPDFLNIGETNLTDLIVDVVAKARALGDRYWRVAAVAEATVLVDGQRLTQGLIQLAANAVRHTLDGDLIEMGSAIRGDRVLLWVRDTGPGVGPMDRERIFARFAQAGPGSAGGAPDGSAGAGIGLGLAIVREITEAHGGVAWVEDATTGGARFVLELPAYYPGQEGHHAPDSHSGGRGGNRLLRRKGLTRTWLHYLRSG
ncbi:HAMP domain-containing sensor histidine kinase [Streptomyces sp. NPDC004610]|uniref:sensor histidine kinase n=1 Tax=unclassified Streptomyces TaxID=2593676 RepID=UPI0033AE92FA